MFPIFLFCINVKMLVWTNTLIFTVDCFLFMQQTTICCGGWHFVQFYFCAVQCSTRFSSRAFTVSYLHQPCFLPDTKFMDPSWQCTQTTSSSTNQSVTPGIIVAYKLMLMPYRIALALITWHWIHKSANIPHLFKNETPSSTSNRTPLGAWCNIRADLKSVAI